MIPRNTEYYDRVVVSGDVVHLTIDLDAHDSLGYFDIRDDDGKVESVTIRQTFEETGKTKTFDPTIAGAREVRHTFSETESGEYRVRARVTLTDGRKITVPAAEPVRVWVSSE